MIKSNREKVTQGVELPERQPRSATNCLHCWLGSKTGDGREGRKKVSAYKQNTKIGVGGCWARLRSGTGGPRLRKGEGWCQRRKGGELTQRRGARGEESGELLGRYLGASLGLVMTNSVQSTKGMEPKERK